MRPAAECLNPLRIRERFRRMSCGVTTSQLSLNPLRIRERFRHMATSESAIEQVLIPYESGSVSDIMNFLSKTLRKSLNPLRIRERFRHTFEYTVDETVVS